MGSGLWAVGSGLWAVGCSSICLLPAWITKLILLIMMGVRNDMSIGVVTVWLLWYNID